MKIFILSFLFITFLSSAGLGQDSLHFYWQKPMGGSLTDHLVFTLKTNDNGIIAIGTTNSINGNATGNHGKDDIVLIKLNANGDVIWQKCFGGPGIENLLAYYYDVSDGGVIIAGTSGAVGGDITVNHGSTDAWILKVSDSGNLLWQRSIGGSVDQTFLGVTKAGNGDYFAFGVTSSNDGDISGNHGFTDFFVCKFTSAGNLVWTKCYGGSGGDGSLNVYYYNYTGIVTSGDGNIIIAGPTGSNDGDVSGGHGSSDVWIAKISSGNGSLIWGTCVGGLNGEAVRDMKQTVSGDIYVYGMTLSTELPNFHDPVNGKYDLYLAKLSPTGGFAWQKCFGTAQADIAYQMELSADGAIYISALIFGNGGDVTGWHGSDDIWIARIRPDASMAWQKALGGSNAEGIELSNQALPFRSGGGIFATIDNGIVINGASTSNDYDVSRCHDPGPSGYENYSNGDIWTVKLDMTGNLVWQYCLGGTFIDGPANKVTFLDDGSCIIGGNVLSNNGDISGGYGGYGNPNMWLCRIGLPVPKTQISSNELYVVDVYPQPARDKINIRFARNFSGRMLISIFDAKGSLVMKNDLGQINTNGQVIPVDVSRLSKGTYFLTVKLDDRSVDTKILIE